MNVTEQRLRLLILHQPTNCYISSLEARLLLFLLRTTTDVIYKLYSGVGCSTGNAVVCHRGESETTQHTAQGEPVLRVMKLEGLSSVDGGLLSFSDEAYQSFAQWGAEAQGSQFAYQNDVIKCCHEIQEQHLHMSVLYLKVCKTQIKSKRRWC